MNSVDKTQNRLIHEKSPYLLQHAHNPVDWYPWGEEAFDRAKAEDKPIFLSIGYSSCHWCHVLREESFEDDEVAELLNENYVSIKVDREERPDIDHIYMTYCQAMTGSGGWPLTIIMGYDQRPFFAGTYFPKNPQMGMPGLIDILYEIASIWKSDRQRLYDIKDEADRAITPAFIVPDSGDTLSEDIIYATFRDLDRSYDEKYGGFGNAPKFPMANHIMFLLRYYKYTGEEDALKMVEGSLKGMYRGGIFDHVGGGFCRYSTDRQWLVPHFEKMLYDNALLATCYLESYLVTKDEFYAYVARRIFNYVKSYLSHHEGGFYTAEDADSEGEEGKFYLFDKVDIGGILEYEEVEKFCAFYNIDLEGNFEGKSIPNRLEEKEAQKPDTYITGLQEKVLRRRDERIRPFRDDKILLGWNGLMIGALALGARVLRDYGLLVDAIRATDFILENLQDKQGRLYGSYRDGRTSNKAYAHDYSYFIWGLIELYESSYNSDYLELAIGFMKDMIELFYDEDGGGFFLYGIDGEELIQRPKDIYDGALPSSNSIATLNLLRLASFTGNSEFHQKALVQFNTFEAIIRENPDGYTAFLMSLMFELFPSSQIVFVGKRNDELLNQMIKELHGHFTPNTVSLALFTDTNNDKIMGVAPFLRDYGVGQGSSAAYVCKDHACQSPITQIELFTETIYNL